jgi:hypothetical protein
MKKLKSLTAKTAVLTIVALSTSVAIASADIITNGNFETDASSFSGYPGTVGYSNPTTIPDWTIAGDSSTGLSGYGLNGPATDGPRFPFQPANYGSQSTDPESYAFIQVASPATTGSNYLYQDITLASDTTYSISFQAAERNTDFGDDGVTGAVNIVNTTLGLVTTSLDSFDFTPVNGDFVTYDSSSDPTLTFTTGLLLPGSVTSIELENTSNVTDTGNHSLDISDVSVTEQAPLTPEPATWALLGVGLLSFGWMARRKFSNI